MAVRPTDHPTPPTTTGRSRWRDLLAPVPGVPRWAAVAAYTVVLTVVPSGLWRSLGSFTEAGRAHGRGQIPAWIPMEAYTVLLSVFSVVVAFTAVGLVAAWGETLPRWIPGIGGRRVPAPAAVIPAALGSTVLTVMWSAVWITGLFGVTVQGDPLPGDSPTVELTGLPLAAFYAAYLPLLLWGPLLGAVTVAYWRRRSA